MLIMYFLNVFEIVPVARIITGITFVFTFHMRCISIVRSLYFRIFSASFFIIIIISIIIKAICGLQRAKVVPSRVYRYPQCTLRTL